MKKPGIVPGFSIVTNSSLARWLLALAVVAAVGEIDYQADRQPDDEAGPVDPAEVNHHVDVDGDAERGDQRTSGVRNGRG